MIKLTTEELSNKLIKFITEDKISYEEALLWASTIEEAKFAQGRIKFQQKLLQEIEILMGRQKREKEE